MRFDTFSPSSAATYIEMAYLSSDFFVAISVYYFEKIVIKVTMKILLPYMPSLVFYNKSSMDNILFTIYALYGFYPVCILYTLGWNGFEKKF